MPPSLSEHLGQSNAWQPRGNFFYRSRTLSLPFWPSFWGGGSRIYGDIPIPRPTVRALWRLQYHSNEQIRPHFDLLIGTKVSYYSGISLQVLMSYSVQTQDRRLFFMIRSIWQINSPNLAGFTQACFFDHCCWDHGINSIIPRLSTIPRLPLICPRVIQYFSWNAMSLEATNKRLFCLPQ